MCSSLLCVVFQLHFTLVWCNSGFLSTLKQVTCSRSKGSFDYLLKLTLHVCLFYSCCTGMFLVRVETNMRHLERKAENLNEQVNYIWQGVKIHVNILLRFSKRWSWITKKCFWMSDFLLPCIVKPLPEVQSQLRIPKIRLKC